MEPYRSVVESCLDFVELVDVVEEGEEDDWHNVKGSAVHLKQADIFFAERRQTIIKSNIPNTNRHIL